MDARALEADERAKVDGCPCILSDCGWEGETGTLNADGMRLINELLPEEERIPNSSNVSIIGFKAGTRHFSWSERNDPRLWLRSPDLLHPQNLRFGLYPGLGLLLRQERPFLAQRTWNVEYSETKWTGEIDRKEERRMRALWNIAARNPKGLPPPVLDSVAAFYAHSVEFTVRFSTKWGPPREWEEDGFLEKFTRDRNVVIEQLYGERGNNFGGRALVREGQRIEEEEVHSLDVTLLSSHERHCVGRCVEHCR